MGQEKERVKMMFLPSKLKQCRIEKAISPTDLVFELARKNFRVSRQTIENWEEGRTMPGADDVATMAMFFRKPIGYFFAQKQQ